MRRATQKTFLVIVLFSIFFITKSEVIDTSYIEVNGIKLHTVLTKPDNDQNYPLAIIVAGSGPTDLDGNQLFLQSNCLKYLSDSLVSNNIATLRYDKRGIAKSSYKEFNESELTIDLFADDLSALIKHGKQKGFSDIYLIGHSQGSLVGLISAQKLSVKGFVSLCGVDNTIDIVIKKQLKTKLAPEQYREAELIIDSLKMGREVKVVSPLLMSILRPSVQPFMISWMNHNPAEIIATLKCSTLIIQGGKDLQVDLEEAKILKNAVPRGKLITIDQMNHVLKAITGGIQENAASYRNSKLSINEKLIHAIVEFINQ